MPPPSRSRASPKCTLDFGPQVGHLLLKPFEPFDVDPQVEDLSLKLRSPSRHIETALASTDEGATHGVMAHLQERHQAGPAAEHQGTLLVRSLR